MEYALTASRYYLDEIHQEFLKYAPAYAQPQAREAIAKVVDLQKQGLLRDGLYYLVLVDLVGSTAYGAQHGNAALASRVERFVTRSFDAFNEAQIRNAGLFVKEIGDAVLFVFQHFPDICRWRHQLNRWLAVDAQNGDPMAVRTCVHIGEVSLRGVNPLSLAVSQVFKMEKAVAADAIVVTEPAYHVAWPTVARAYRAFREVGQVELDGYVRPVRLHELQVGDGEDLARIVDERLD